MFRYRLFLVRVMDVAMFAVVGGVKVLVCCVYLTCAVAVSGGFEC